ncbi:MAG: hypothetical protein J7M38_05475 [Armatimonadetes bacterium]|nr:hypothetical protein [Armatimonadota bacterium]
MTGVDYGVVIVYLALVAGVGFVVRGRIAGLEDYFAGGHRLPWWLAAISHHISGWGIKLTFVTVKQERNQGPSGGIARSRRGQRLTRAGDRPGRVEDGRRSKPTHITQGAWPDEQHHCLRSLHQTLENAHP